MTDAGLQDMKIYLIDLGARLVEEGTITRIMFTVIVLPPFRLPLSEEVSEDRAQCESNWSRGASLRFLKLDWSTDGRSDVGAGAGSKNEPIAGADDGWM